MASILTASPRPFAVRSTRTGQHVGMVANLRPVKGMDVFAAAAARLSAEFPDLRFTVAGEGELRPELERQVAALGLSQRFQMPGAQADVPGFLAGLDIAILSSRSEGLSNALLEYMAAGRAIVATDVGGNPRLIEHGVHGLLVPPDDAQALAVAVARLLREPELALRLSRAARRRVEEEHSREAMVRRFEQFYLRLVGRDEDAE